MSTNLGASQVATNQNNKETTINDAVGQMDAALTEQLSTALAGANPSVTITTAQMQDNNLLAFTDGAAPSGTATINIPGTLKRGFFRVRNGSSIPVDVGISGQSATKPRVFAGQSKTLYSDGTNVISGEGGEAGGQAFDLGIFFPGTMSNSQLLCRYVFTRDVDFPANMTGSQAKAVSGATAQTDIDVQKNGASIGTVRFAAAGTIATFVGFSASSFAAGDIFSLHAPVSADATLADVGFTFKGARRA